MTKWVSKPGMSRHMSRKALGTIRPHLGCSYGSRSYRIHAAMPSAPAVLLGGHLVAHTNDVDALPRAHKAMSAALAAFPQTSQDRSLNDALAAQEDGSPGSVCSWRACVSSCGTLARRLRSGVRSRGALAHPGRRPAKDIEEALRDSPASDASASASMAAPG